MEANKKGLGIQQLKVLFYLQRGGYILAHHNLDKGTHDYTAEVDGDVLSCTKSIIDSLVKRGLVYHSQTITTMNPNTETLKYILCTNTL